MVKQKKQQQVVDYSKPVAYDVDGRPLYAHPPVEETAAFDESRKRTPQLVHLVRESEPQKQEISETIKLKHQRSKKAYPTVSLSDGEYVIMVLKRHFIGLVPSIFLGLFLLILSFAVLFNAGKVLNTFSYTGLDLSGASIILPVILFVILVLIGMYVVYYVYVSNRLFLTNESVIQVVQESIFSRREQIVSLADIEDVSFSQRGIAEQLFDYGSVRLSTEGNGTVYSVLYVAQPKRAISSLNNAIESFKNGRPIEY